MEHVNVIRVRMGNRVSPVQLVNTVPDVTWNVREVVRTESVIDKMEPACATKVLMEVNAIFVKRETMVQTATNGVRPAVHMEHAIYWMGIAYVCLDLVENYVIGVHMEGTDMIANVCVPKDVSMAYVMEKLALAYVREVLQVKCVILV